MADQQLTVHAHEPSMNQPNDIAIDSHDRIFASDPSWKESTGNLWRINIDGSVHLLEKIWVLLMALKSVLMKNTLCQ